MNFILEFFFAGFHHIIQVYCLCTAYNQFVHLSLKQPVLNNLGLLTLGVQITSTIVMFHTRYWHAVH